MWPDQKHEQPTANAGRCTLAHRSPVHARNTAREDHIGCTNCHSVSENGIILREKVCQKSRIKFVHIIRRFSENLVRKHVKYVRGNLVIS